LIRKRKSRRKRKRKRKMSGPRLNLVAAQRPQPNFSE
jgi:hypothetical protein